MNNIVVPDAPELSDFSSLQDRMHFLATSTNGISVDMRYNGKQFHAYGPEKQANNVTFSNQLTHDDTTLVVDTEADLVRNSLIINNSGHEYKMETKVATATAGNVALLCKTSATPFSAIRCNSKVKYTDEDFYRYFYNELKFTGSGDVECLGTSTYKSAKLCKCTYNSNEYYGLYYPKKTEYVLDKQVATRKVATSSASKQIGLVYTYHGLYLTLMSNGKEVNSANRIKFTQLTPSSESKTYWNYGGVNCYWFCCTVGDLRKLSGLTYGVVTGADIDNYPDTYYVYFDLYISTTNMTWSGDRIYIYPSLISAANWNKEKTLTGTQDGKYVEADGVICVFHYNPQQDMTYRESNSAGKTYLDYFFLLNENIWRVDPSNVSFNANTAFLLVTLYTSVTFTYTYVTGFKVKNFVLPATISVEASGVFEKTDEMPTGYSIDDISQIVML